MGSRQAVLEELRVRIRALERGGDPAVRESRTLPLGIAAIDRLLPGGGLPLGRVHEIAEADGGGAATGFILALLVRLRRLLGQGAVLWCGRRVELYGPGLAAFGFEPERLLLLALRTRADLLWAMEEGLRCKALAAAVAEIETVGGKDSRRLQLAAEAGGVTGFLLRRGGAEGKDGAAFASRWRVGCAPRAEMRPRWRVELLRCRGGGTGAWLLDWNDETGDLSLAAPLPDRPMEAGTAAFGRTGGR